MTQKNVIAAGYRLTVISWENDADNYKTAMVEGITLDQVAFFVKLCKLMADRFDYKNRVCNLYEPDDEERLRLRTALAEIVRGDEWAKQWIEINGVEDVGEWDYLDDDTHGDAQTIEDIQFAEMAMSTLHDLELAGGDYLTRVCSDWKVEHIPQAITLTDVTAEFM